MSSEDSIQEQVTYYIRFVEKILKPKLLNAESAANIVRAEITNYEELVTRMKDTTDKNEPIESLVDIGHKTIFCNAVVKEPSKIFVKVGMGFHVELSPEEATEFSNKRVAFLRANKLSEKESEIKDIKGHIQSASIILDQLHKEMERSG